MKSKPNRFTILMRIMVLYGQISLHFPHNKTANRFILRAIDCMDRHDTKGAINMLKVVCAALEDGCGF